MTKTGFTARMGVVAVAAILGCLPASAEGVKSTVLGDYEYRTFCASCHGPGAAGDGPLASMLKIAPSNLTTLSQGNGGVFPRERLQKFIDGRADVAAHGKRDMPVWGDWFSQEVLSDQLFLSEDMRSLSVAARIDGLVAYIESLQVK